MNDNILSTSADLLDILRMDALLQILEPPSVGVDSPSVGVDSPSVGVDSPSVASDLPATLSTGSSPIDVAAVPQPSVTEEQDDDVNMDEYMARFEKIQTRNESEKQLISKLLEHTHAGGPLMSMVIDAVVSIHTQNEEMYSLLVDMNNLFGK